MKLLNLEKKSTLEGVPICLQAVLSFTWLLEPLIGLFLMTVEASYFRVVSYWGD
jgi:hypothetical protein